MLDILRNFFDALLPPHPTTLNLRSETPEKFLRLFKLRNFRGVMTLCDYKEEVMKTAIKANKFHNDQHASTLLAVLVEKWLEEQPVRPTVFVPIPLSTVREKDRGYNQVTRVLEKVMVKESILVKNLLIRTKDTLPQTKMQRNERLTNMNGVFAFKGSGTDLGSYRVILVDDVITTGSTLTSAYEVLKANLPESSEVVCLALAH